MADFTAGMGSGAYLQLSMQEAGTNQGGNYSAVNWQLYLVVNSSSYEYDPIGWSTNIGGAGYSGTYTFSGSGVHTIATGTTNVGHAADGTGSCYGSGYTGNTGTSIGGPTSVGGTIGLTRIPKPPTAPQSLSILVTARNAALTWNPPANNNGASIAGYGVQYSKDGGAWSSASGTTSTKYTYTGLTSASSYQFRVYAYNSAGSSGYTTSSSYTIPSPPNAPAAPAVSVTSTTTATVSWTAPSNGGSAITGYSIQYDEDSAFGSPTTVTDNASPYTATGLSAGVKYYWRVAATNAVATGAYSSSANATQWSVPSAPRSLGAAASTTAFDQINLTWTAPTTDYTGITGYTIYASGTKIGTTTGTGTTYTAIGLADNTSYTFTVRARNAYADSAGLTSADSNTATAVAPGPPTAVQALTATASEAVAGRITLSWAAPATTGAGGITHYSVYYSYGTVITSSVAAGTTTYSVDGLVPGSTYNFYVRAWNAIADTVGTPGAQSNTASATAIGQPDAPTGFTVTSTPVVPSRLVLSWTQPGSYTSFNIYEVISGVRTFIANTKTTTFSIDNLNTAPHTYVIAARNAVTDAVVPPSEGPPSASATGTPGLTATQTVPSTAVSDSTTAVFNGTHNIVAITGTTISYSKINANIPTTNINSGTVTDNTNVALNGSYVITTTPSITSFTYADTISNIPANTAVTSGSVTDNTNTIFNGEFTVTAVDESSNAVSYAKTNSGISHRAGGGTVIDNTNIVYNGTDLEILSTPSINSFTYAVSHADIDETTASGLATDRTNVDVFNGSYSIISTPDYKSLTYARVADDIDSREIGSPYGVMYRANSKATLKVMYRSGWAG